MTKDYTTHNTQVLELMSQKRQAAILKDNFRKQASESEAKRDALSTKTGILCSDWIYVDVFGFF